MSTDVVKERMAKFSPFEVFQKKLVTAFEAKHPSTKAEWGEMIKQAKADTVKELKAAGGKPAIIKAAIYVNAEKSDVFKTLHDTVPGDAEELSKNIVFVRPMVAKENTAYVEAATKHALKPKAKRKNLRLELVGKKLPHIERLENAASVVRKEWNHLQGELDRLGKDAPQELRDEAIRVGLELFELESGIDFSGATAQEKDLISAVLEKAELGAHAIALSGTPRNYLGGHLGGWESLTRGAQATDELDEIAKRHDAEFILASLEADPAHRKAMIRKADDAMVKAIDDLIYDINTDKKQSSIVEKDRLQVVATDAEKARTALQAKMGLDEVGLTPSDWTTAGLKLMPEAVRIEKAKKMFDSMATYLEKVEAHGAQAGAAETVKALPGSNAARYRALGTGGKFFDPDPVISPPESVKVPVEPEAPEVGAEAVPEPSAEVKPEEGAGKVQKVSMDLDSILNELKDMNRGTRNPNDIFSLKPITGERNMRPMLVKGDVENILDRKPAEVVDNLDFYANWKFVQPGWSNGNQQLLPGQIGVPFRNSLLRAQWENQDYQFMDNFDVGARDWYDKTYMPHRRRDMDIHSRRMGYKFRMPMIRDTQTHQLPTRNGALPAGVGRPIHFATETSNGFDIYTPTQRLDARQTRLFNGDVVDGRRV